MLTNEPGTLVPGELMESTSTFSKIVRKALREETIWISTRLPGFRNGINPDDS